MSKSASAKMLSLDWAHPLVRQWFLARFGSPTEPQLAGWPHILAGQTTLISAPTGSGKTLTAFLACIDKLVRKAVAGKLEDKTEVVYVSPLKALSNDIQINLDDPLSEILALAESQGITMQRIRTAVRTGDTLASERQAMLKRPPHILVTTPESLYILLTAEKSRANLSSTQTIIVDEIHAVADDKRGAHLSLSLERLEHLCKKTPVRIGLSATQKPIELIARFLAGSRRPQPVIVDVGHKRQLDVAIAVPGMPLGAVASNEQWGETYDRLAELIQSHKSTLIFVNTRKLAERVTMNLAERLGEEAVAAHHGSLSRKLRLSAERRLKSGQLKALVATASLELGIDIGAIDLVCQLGSPRSIAVALQRIGRAGHWRGAVPKGRIFPTTRDELMECAALVKAIETRELDKIIIPECSLDILAQQITAMCSSTDWSEDDLYEAVTAASPYANLDKKTFYEVLEMLAEGISARRGRYGAYLLWDRVNKVLKGRRGARLAAITSGGAIPETGLYTVVAEPDGLTVGTLDEDFAIESNGGDIILLGNASWRIRRVESAAGRVIVEDAHGAPPTVPFWLGEGPSRTPELSLQVAKLRLLISEAKDPDALMRILQTEYGLDQSGAEQAIEYILEGKRVLGAVPQQDLIIAERFFDEGGGMQLVIHSPFGGRINKAWGLALRKCFCRSFNFELQAAATDDGLNISLAEQHSFPLSDVFTFLSPESLKHILEQAVLASPIFTSRFRWDATRALALLRFQGGKKVPPYLQRLKADDLLAAVFPDAAACQDNLPGDIELPNHPLINEVMKDVLTEALDLEGLSDVIAGLRDGRIKTLSVDTPVPSVFSHEILNANPYAYLDDAPLEERRARAVEMRRVLPDSMKEVGQLDPAAVKQVQDEAWPDVRDHDELHDLLQTLIVLPESAVVKNEWVKYFDQLKAERRAAKVIANDKIFFVAAEKKKVFAAIYPQAQYLNELPDLDLPEKDDPAERLLSLLRGWLSVSGPITASELASLFALDQAEIAQALLMLEATGAVLRGQFRLGVKELEWCDRRLLARIHRLTVSALRQSIEPATSAQFMRWLTHWQHVAAGSQVAGDERGTLEIIRQLQGFEVPVSAWEHQILARRVKNYEPEFLDKLCLTGQVGWGRLSPHPATLDQPVAAGRKRRRVTPTSNAPIAFFVRADCDWMNPQHPAKSDDNQGLSNAAIAVKEYLRQRGASFFADIVRGSGRLMSEIEGALWELVAAGLVTADGFDNLRALIDRKRRLGDGYGRFQRPRHSSGRWSLLHINEVERGAELEAICWMYLRRYGVVFRDLLVRESVFPRWRELLITFRRLEDRGEVRGGRFVTGFSGEQFALPEAVESLRASRHRQPESEILVLSAADPLNLIGIVLPGEKISSTSTNTVVLRDGMEVNPQAKKTKPA
ncbi:MAG: DEAD/DEAH box helicase [Candidatus Obscuribacterales bacterium]|nr:DEAD/DEAH box helicase [Candidatus Obscuribacterales bacterium]